MNHKLKQFIRDAAHVKLRDTDRAAMRAHFAELAGIPNASEPIKTHNSPWTFFHFHRTAAMSFSAAALAILVTTGVAAASEGTIPGDILYPIKVHVTEEARSAILRTPAAKAAWETRRLERRLAEAEKIVQRNVNPRALSSLGIDINAHTERVQNSIDDMERSGNIQAAAEASSNIEAPLAAHKKILQEMKKSQKETARIIETVEDNERSMNSRRQNLEQRIEERDKKEKTPDTNKESNTPTPPKDTVSFSSKQRTRREKQEREVLDNAENELQIFVPHEDEQKAKNTRDESNNKNRDRE